MSRSDSQSLRDSAIGHELVDHTSEITLRVRAPTFPELIAEATRAFGGLVPASMREQVSEELREFQVGGADRVAMLVAWLNELVFLCEAEQWLPVEVTVTPEDHAAMRVRAKGVDLEKPFVMVKAATLHRASLKEGPRGLVGEVTLDV